MTPGDPGIPISPASPLRPENEIFKTIKIEKFSLKFIRIGEGAEEEASEPQCHYLGKTQLESEKNTVLN